MADLKRTEDTKNYAVFKTSAPKKGKVAAFGTIYIPLAEAEGKTSIEVSIK